MAQEESSFNISRYGLAVEAFNRDDLGPLSELFADDCVFTSSLGPIGNTRDEIIAFLRQGRANGWKRHVLLSVAAAGDFVVFLFRNEFGQTTGDLAQAVESGATSLGGGVIRVNNEGKISEVRTLDPPASQP